MVRCKCGLTFRSEREWREHYLVGKPVLFLSYYGDREKENEAIRKREEWDAKHIVAILPKKRSE